MASPTGFPPPSVQDPTKLFPSALRIADTTIAKKLKDTPAPSLKKKGNIILHRFPSKDLDTYLLLKIVQLSSNLRAGKILIDNGFTYEWNTLYRAIDESTQHVLVLLSAHRENQWQAFHDNVLAAFFQEDINQKGKISAHPPKHIPPAAIRSSLQSSIEESDNIPPEFLDKAAPTLKSLQKIKSGYVHGRAASIMSLYDHENKHFLTNGQCPNKNVALRSLWRATYSAIGGCVAQTGLEWFGRDYFSRVAEFAEQFRRAARVGESFDRKVLNLF